MRWAIVIIATLAACSASHTSRDASLGDASGDGDVGTSTDADMTDSGVSSDSGADGGWVDASVPDCRLACSADVIARGPRRSADTASRVILASASDTTGRIAAVLAYEGVSEGESIRNSWTLASLEPGATTFDEAGQWPLGPRVEPYPFDGEVRTLDAVVRPSAESTDMVVLFTRREYEAETEIHLGHVRWDRFGRCQSAEDLGLLGTLPWLVVERGTMAELPGGDLLVATTTTDQLRLARVAWSGATPSLVERFDRPLPGGLTGEGAPAVSGGTLGDDAWLLAVGGRTATNAWDVRGVAYDGATELWTGALGGERFDPAPVVAGGPEAATVFRWAQNRLDVDDTSVLMTEVTSSGVESRVRFATRGVELPLAAHAGQNTEGSLAVWSVRARSALADTILYAAMTHPTADCRAADVLPVAQIPGGASSPSVHTLVVGSQLVALAFSTDADEQTQLVALDVSCRPEG